ncbi:MAG: hypothetical protein NVS3B5_17640 [Sphingomicrobium sp.]
MREKLFPRATVVTPNVPEAAMLLGEDLATDELACVAQAQRLLALGPQAVLLKGGHAGGDEAVDFLISGNNVVQRIASARLRSIHRGTGCALASAVTAGLASGTPIFDACHQAKRYVGAMLLTSIQH